VSETPGRECWTHLAVPRGGYAGPPPFLSLDGPVLGSLDVPRRSDAAVEDRFDAGPSLVLLFYLAENLAIGRSGLHAKRVDGAHEFKGIERGFHGGVRPETTVSLLHTRVEF
jgi:hypothetical protein